MDPIPQSKRTAERRGSRRSAEPDALQNIAAAVAEIADPFAALVAVA